MFAKVIILIAMFVILGALLSSLIFLLRDGSQNKRSVKALSLRIGLSLFLFVFLFVAFRLGWIAPHSLS